MPPAAAATNLALRGRLVTMDAAGSVVPDGIVYVRGNSIVAAQPAALPPPAGFEAVPVTATGGTIYPGLIELHNHLSYDALPLWNVPQKFTNRDQWTKLPEYHRLVPGAMAVLGKMPQYTNAIVRLVECRCLLGGVTTSQGIALASDAGIERHYCGLVRNVESPGDLAVRAAGTHISDVDATQAQAFLQRLQTSSCLLLHLSEGTDDAAHDHFAALQLPDQTWAIAPSLAGIHCVALKPEDFQTMQQHGASMIWSPLSNLLLYGETADIAAAKASGIKMGLGSDWAPSGSKNLLGELKVARLVSAAQGGVFSDEELVGMATRNAAQILRWDAVVGSIEAGKRADLLVVAGTGDDPYTHLIVAKETDLSLVVIDGVPRYGIPDLMGSAGTQTEDWPVGGSPRKLCLAQDSADPDVGALSLRQAYDLLADGLRRLPELAAQPAPHAMKTAAGPGRPRWTLVLDHDDPAGKTERPHLPYRGKLTAMPAAADASHAAKTAAALVSETIDPLTVADDPTFLTRLAAERNLPGYLIAGLPGLYA